MGLIGMAAPLVELVTNKLGTVLKERVSLVGNASQELQNISSEFKAIQAVLNDAERRQISYESVRLWLEKLKEVASDMDDVLDEWITSAPASRISDGYHDDSSGNGTVTVLNSSSSQEGNLVTRGWGLWKNAGDEGGSIGKKARTFYSSVVSWNDVAQRVSEIRLRLDQIAKEKNDYSFKENYCLPQGGRSAMDEFETSSLLDESKIIGREFDQEEIISRLVSGAIQEDGRIDVISIVGVGGLGKTTLAGLISQDKRVKQHFEKVFWVCVSKDFDVKRIMKEIIEDDGNHGPLPSALNPLQKKLLQTIQEKRFLLILDDIWNEDVEKWEKLRVVLQSGAHGSKILITTRSKKVSRMVNTAYMHELNGLSEEEGWLLFSGKAFGGRRVENQSGLEKIGKEIVKKCSGVPLTLKVMGSAMQSKMTVGDWQNILESEIWALPEAAEGILPSLLLSYNNLSVKLKQCFAYCSIFPKGSYIEKDKLVKMWLAQGFIQSQGRREMEDIGGEYFDGLIERSMFQDFEKTSTGSIRCKMHDLLHDFAKFITKDDSRIFEIGKSDDSDPSSIDPSSIKVRHASMIATTYGMSGFLPLFSSIAEKLRTLRVRGYGEIGTVSASLFHHAKLLRVLDLGEYGIEIRQLPECVGELKQLRYLDLSSSDIRELPESLSRLCNLETLKLNSCPQLRRLPGGMSRMQSLRHLEIERTHSLEYLPKGLGKLTSLRTLSRFILGGEEGCEIGELKQLNSLRGLLRIENFRRVWSAEDAEEAELWRKAHLCELHLSLSSWSIDRVLEGFRPPHENLRVLKIRGYGGSKFPTWIEDLPFSNLVDLTLEICGYCEQLPGLGTLPELKRLTLFGIGVRRVDSEFYYGMNRSGGGRARVRVAFPKLEYLRFERLFELEEWEWPITTSEAANGNDEEEIMPSLQQLTIFHCTKLKALPQYLPSTPTFKRLEIGNLPELTALPDGLGQLKELRHLEIRSLEKLTSLPDVLGELKALECLRISNCNALASLPQGLKHLTNLQNLNVSGCRLLTERCRRDGGFRIPTEFQ